MRAYGCVITIAGCLAISPAAAQSPEVGEGLFNQYCSSCHGSGGAGDGPMVEYLTIPSPDLTQLAARNDGAFPMLKVIHIIDGRTGVRGHGGQMPVFGDLFMAEQGEGAARSYTEVLETRGRVLSVAMYLESLQK
ncbi:cytochrome c [Sinirhodobacter sp. WL0062]|uniref:Cytochrome c n=1 Tax=Rhodobacter flavimaris TaxID=2907145 RepID=A0ABS8YY78_9RHOB|nr:cytochrome c [Sinirhodobacter sp. WL0062]MCE5973716.1 cytochrome c [Sinirhodobacter sp. WL0062]